MVRSNAWSLEAAQTDSAELHRLNRALLLVTGAHHALLQSHDEIQLLQEVCRIAVEEGGYKMAWVGFAEHDDHKSIRPVASAGFEDGYLEKANVSWGDNERGQGPGGRSIRSGKPAIARISEDPAFAPWREEALKRGYQANISLPLMDEGAVIGELAIYAADAGAFDPPEVRALEELANDLSLGLKLLRSSAKRAEAERRAEDLRASLASNMLRSMNNEVMLRAIYDQAPMGIVRLDRQRRFISVNVAFAQMLGYAPEELAGRSMEELTHPEDRQASQAFVERTEETGFLRRFDKRYLHKSGAVVWGRVTSRLLRLDGEKDSLLSMVEDINDLRELEAKVEFERRSSIQNAKLASLGLMSASIAHEINNPVTVIGMAAAMAEESQGDPAALAANLKAVREASERLAAIVQRLKRFGRSSAQLDLKPAALGAMVLEAIGLTQAQAKSQGVTVHARVESTAEVLCNEIEIEQVLVNLIVNATQAAHGAKEPWVEVHALEESGEAILRVSDSGPGVPPEAVPSLFEPFFTTKAPGEGTGLGLAIVKGIVEAHKGSIRLRQDKPHTCFEIRLPLWKPAGA